MVLRKLRSPARLKLEITESTILDNVENTIQTMHKLRALCLSFPWTILARAILLYLICNAYPNQLKIDRSFERRR